MALVNTKIEPIAPAHFCSAHEGAYVNARPDKYHLTWKDGIWFFYDASVDRCPYCHELLP